MKMIAMYNTDLHTSHDDTYSHYHQSSADKSFNSLYFAASDYCLSLQWDLTDVDMQSLCHQMTHARVDFCKIRNNNYMITSKINFLTLYFICLQSNYKCTHKNLISFTICQYWSTLQGWSFNQIKLFIHWILSVVSWRLLSVTFNKSISINF